LLFDRNTSVTSDMLLPVKIHSQPHPAILPVKSLTQMSYTPSKAVAEELLYTVPHINNLKNISVVPANYYTL